MNHSSVGVVRSAILVLLASCTSDNGLSLPAPPPGYPAAYATAACAPFDGPATQLFLAAEPAEELPPPAPFIEVAIWRDVMSLSGRRVEWAGASSDGMARRCDPAGACVDATSVAVQFRPFGADTAVTGVAVLSFADGSTVTGGFNAAWRHSQLMCG